MEFILKSVFATDIGAYQHLETQFVDFLQTVQK